MPCLSYFITRHRRLFLNQVCCPRSVREDELSTELPPLTSVHVLVPTPYLSWTSPPFLSFLPSVRVGCLHDLILNLISLFPLYYTPSHLHRFQLHLHPALQFPVGRALILRLSSAHTLTLLTLPFF